MKQIKLLFASLIICSSLYSQDLIIKKNGDEIKAKVLEVALKIIKFKKQDNVNGPTFEILKSEVFMIKYDNGTKDIINQIETITSSKAEEKDDTDPTETNNKKILAFTDKHRSTTIVYGLSALFGGITSYGSGVSALVLGPVMLSFDKALSNKFSLAFRPAVMYYGYKINSGYSGYSSNGSLLFGGLQVRIDYHFATSEKLDPYFGLGGGVGYFFGGGDENGIRGAYPIYGGGFGIKSYGKNKNAFLVELGYDSYSYLKIGYVIGRHK